MTQQKYAEPKRADATNLAYIKRCNQLFSRAHRELGVLVQEPVEFANWLKAHVANLSHSTIRQYKAAAMEHFEQNRRSSLEERARKFEAGIAVLKSIDVSVRLRRSQATSATKMKGFPEEMAAAVLIEIDKAAGDRAKDLGMLLRANLLVGARPVEWAAASWTFHDHLSAGSLKLPNAKNTHGRSHGPSRMIYFTNITPHWHELLSDWTRRARNIACDRSFADYVHDLQDMLAKMLRELFPGKRSYPTLYSSRHEAIARWKEVYMSETVGSENWLRGAAVIAAMSGHANDLTASKHYKRANKKGARKSAYPIPEADPDEVARIRPKIAAQTVKLFARAERLGSTNRDANKISKLRF